MQSVFLRIKGKVASHKNPFGVAVCLFYFGGYADRGGLEQRRARQRGIVILMIQKIIK